MGAWNYEKVKKVPKILSHRFYSIVQTSISAPI